MAASKTLYFDIIGRDRGAASAMQKVGTQMAAFAVAGGVAIGYAIKQFADFDAQMSQVKTLSGATAGQMDLLRDAALHAGQSIGFSATQVADAETELVKAGLSVTNILNGGLTGALNLAAAGQMDVADATSIAVSTMTEYGLKGKDVGHIADLLAAGADKALGSVSDLGEGLKYVGPVAASMGIDVESTVGVLAELAQNGIMADQAGTGLRGMLQALTAPSVEAAGVMKQYGINIYDAAGKFVGLSGVAEQLKTKLGTLDDAQRNAALGTIFGNKQVTTATVLMTGGAKAVDDQGFAAKQAAGKMDNLEGDLKKLQAAFQTDVIEAGSGANDVLRGLTQSVTSVLSVFGELPPLVQGGAVALGALATAGAGVGAVMILGTPKILEFSKTLKVLAASDIPAVSNAASGLINVTGKAGKALSSTASFLTGPWGVAIAAGATGALVFTDIVRNLGPSLDQMENAAKTASDGMGGFTAAMDKAHAHALNLGPSTVSVAELKGELHNAAEESKNFFSTNIDHAHDLGTGIDALNQYGESLTQLAATDFPAAQKSFAQFSDEYKLNATEQWRAINNMAGYKDALVDQATTLGLTADKHTLLALATGASTTKTQSAADVYTEAANNAKTLDDNLNQLISDLNKANNTNQDAITKNAAYQDALAGVVDTIKKAKDGTDGYSTSLDQSTQAGADNVSMFADLAQKSQDSAAAQFQLDGNTQSYIGNLQAGKQALIDQITNLTGNAGAAQDLANKIYAIPDQKQIDIQTNALQIKSNVDALNDAIANLKDKKTIQIVTEFQQTLGQNTVVSGRGAGAGKAGGGDLDFAPGPKGVDSALFMGAKGEHVLTASDVDAMGGQSAVYAFRRALHSGGLSQSAAIALGHQTATPASIPASGGGALTVVQPVRVEITQKVTGVPLSDLIDARIETAQGWQQLELDSGVAR